MTASHSAQAAQSIGQRAQYVLQCPHQTEIHFPEGDPRREVFSHFETCLVPVIIRPTEHPNIVEIESPAPLHRFDYVLYSAEHTEAFEHLGQSFFEAWNALMQRYPQYIAIQS